MDKSLQEEAQKTKVFYYFEKEIEVSLLLKILTSKDARQGQKNCGEPPLMLNKI